MMIKKLIFSYCANILINNYKYIEEIFMYHILTYNNGQPIILYQENKNVYMYTIDRGRISSKGIVFDDVAKNLCIFTTPVNIVYYISDSGHIKLASLHGERFIEFLSLPLTNPEEDSTIISACPVSYKKELYIFYLTRGFDKNTYSVYYVKSTSASKSTLIADNLKKCNCIHTTVLNDILYIVLSDLDSSQFLCLDEGLNVHSLLHSDDAFSDMKSTYEEQITRITKQLEDKEKELSALNKQLSAQKSEIKKLNSTQKYMEAQYNDLADFAGQLQDELRKIMYAE